MEGLPRWLFKPNALPSPLQIAIACGSAVVTESNSDMKNTKTDPSVNILMATYNGELYLDEQLTTIYNQDIRNINVIISDDGSCDKTNLILNKWKFYWKKGNFIILDGPRCGYSENFRSLLYRADINANYTAFCDQDDVWHENKLSVAINALEKCGESLPGLYCSRTMLINEAGAAVGFSPKFGRPTSFSNAIVQSIGGGNTMVLNKAAFELAAESARRTSFVSHDWWCYMLITGTGGKVLYDATPHIGYRQHAANLIGKNTGAVARIKRIKRLFEGQLKGWNDQNIAALRSCDDLLTDEARRIIIEFSSTRSKSLRERIVSFHRSGLYRQSRMGTIALLASVILGKL